MKKINVIICFAMCFVFLFSTACSCSDNKPSDGGGSRSDVSVIVKETDDKMLVRSCVTEYKVVVPEEAVFLENYAAKEFVTYMNRATACSFDIVKDSNATKSDKIISIGRTKFAEENNLETQNKKKLDDGFIIKTIDDDIYLLGNGDYGTLYSVYEILEILIDFKVYAADEIYYKNTNDVKFYQFDYEDYPDFETRYISDYNLSGSGYVFDAALFRLNAIGNSLGAVKLDENGAVQDIWGEWAHSLDRLLPVEDYYGEHPEWFDGSNSKQVKMTDEECAKQVAENLKAVFQRKPDSKYFMVGMRDNGGFDKDDEAYAKEHGITLGGVYVIFLNRIAEHISAWLKEEGVERDFVIVGLAYCAYENSPTVKNDDGSYAPISETVTCNEHVGMMFAPISLDFSKKLGDSSYEQNVTSYESIKGWSVCAENLFVWSYCIDYGSYLVDFNNWNSIQYNYQVYKDLGVDVIFDQATSQTQAPFRAVRLYVQSQLLWDTSLNVTNLLNDFMDNYYKMAAPYVKKVFYLIRSNYEYLYDNGIITKTLCANSPYYNNGTYNNTAEHWSFNLCFEMLNTLNEGIEQIKKSGLSNSIKETLINRVNIDKVMPLYLILLNYKNSVYATEYKEMLNEFEEITTLNNIAYWHESWSGANLPDMIEACR